MFLYCIIGLASAGTDTFFFWLFVYKFTIYSIVANCMSVFIGICISFTLNLNINFKTKDRVFKRYLSFLTVGIFGMVISTGIIALGEHFRWNILWTKIETIIIVSAIQFVLNKFVSFRKTKLVAQDVASCELKNGDYNKNAV